MKTKKLTPYQQMEISIREAEGGTEDKTVRRVGDELRKPGFHSEQERNAGLTEASQPGAGPTNDDLAPETSIHEDGAISPLDIGEDVPADRTYRIVGADEIGVGLGLDEAELAHVDPLDGEPWDEDAESQSR